MTAEDAATLTKRALEAVAAKDLDALAATWHDDLVEDFVVIGPVRGKEAARSFCAELFGGIPDMEFKIERVMGAEMRLLVLGSGVYRAHSPAAAFKAYNQPGAPSTCAAST